jgi:hypothetical protein
MVFEKDESLDLKDARRIMLGGVEFFIAPLSIRQIMAIADQVPKVIGLSAANLSSERIAPLADVVWHGLRRVHPNLTREEFLDLPMTIAELLAALPVVIEQGGGKTVKNPGEFAATSAMSDSTGASSSPISSST